MPKKKTSWQEKLQDNKGCPKVVVINDKMSKRWGTGTVVIQRLSKLTNTCAWCPKAN